MKIDFFLLFYTKQGLKKSVCIAEARLPYGKGFSGLASQRLNSVAEAHGSPSHLMQYRVYIFVCSGEANI